MEDINQELEFLDLSDLPENEVQNLRSVIGGLTIHECVRDVELPMGRQVSESAEGLGEAFGELGVTVPFSPSLDVGGPSVGYHTPNQVHPSLYQQNVCITSIPQYPTVMNYSQMQMLSGPHIVGTNPSYLYGNLHGPGIPHPTTFNPPPPIMNPPLSNYPKRKNVRPKYQPRKDVANGHVDGYSNIVYQPAPPYMGPCFPGDVVQAVTGVPIVMHQSVPSYVPPQSVEVSAANTTQIYPIVTFAPAVPAVPVSIDVFAPQVEESVPVDVSSISLSIPTSVMQTEKSQGQKMEITVSSEVPTSVSQPAVISEEKPLPNDSSEGKSWASLFKTTPAIVTHEKPTARVEPFTPMGNVALVEMSQAVSRPLVDVRIRRLAEHLVTCDLVTTPLALLPRGLINKSNWCYINATLQALIACSPFVHLMKSLAPYAGGRHEDSSTPILDSVIEFIDQFDVVPVRSGKERSSAKKEEPQFGTSFEPSSVYKMLSKIRSETFKVEGRQEDAEEFLSCLLNGLHDEMLDALKSTREDKVPAHLFEPKPGTSDDEDWQVIGPKNRGCVTHTTSYSKTPVSNLFLGQMRSALHYTGAQSATATLQPFFSLQLDIQNEKVNSVRDALACLVSKEPLTGYVCSKTGQEVEASRQTTLEELPPVLILHLKCFVYDKSGGCQKLLKRVEFSSDLELSKDFLSPMQKGKLKERQRQYKLFAVVYHDGKEATKGHYVTEVHHSGTGNWLRFDDSIVRVVDTQLFKYNLPRMPYLLLYRKLNL